MRLDHGVSDGPFRERLGGGTDCACRAFASQCGSGRAGLVRRLADGDGGDVVIVHHDPTGEPWEAARRVDLPNVFYIPADSVIWGHWSHVEAIVRSFEFALSLPGVQWVLVHSGQDYPLVLERTDARIAGSHRSAMDSCQGNPSRSRTRAASIQKASLSSLFAVLLSLHRNPAIRCFAGVSCSRSSFGQRGAVSLNSRQRLVRFSLNGFWRRNLIGFRTTDRWLGGRVMYKSSDWLILSRDSVEVVVEATRDRPFVNRYRRTLCPTESFFATVLANRDAVNLAHDDHRFIRWTGGEHPEILTSADFEELVASGDLFAA